MMKNVVLSLLIISTLVCVSVAFKNEDDTYSAFVNYMYKYNKQYAHDEMNTRYENFKASLARVAEKNKKSSSAKFGITKFSDMSKEEFAATMLMNKFPKSPKKTVDNVLPKKGNSVDLPDRFDWREKGAVTPIKDQGQCGSCWAFSTIENVESVSIIAGKATNTTISLSPQQLVDCDWASLGCDGGNPPFAYEYIMHAGGVASESEYPYTAEGGSCYYNSNMSVASISTWKWATWDWSESDLQQNLVNWSPLSVCVEADEWQDYTSGVMTHSECAFVVNALDHCVQLVGYDTTNPTLGNYWIVRNSWGLDWGNDGYIYLAMGQNTCGITDEPTTAVI